MRRPVVSGLAAASFTLLMPALAAGATCFEQVRDLAERHGIATDPPTVTPGESSGPGGRATTDDLARSGGVIEPPQSSDKSVITPPPVAAESRMPTVPDVVPAQGRDRAPAQMAEGTLQALLVAARAQAERGMETQCLERLAEARRLAARSQ